MNLCQTLMQRTDKKMISVLGAQQKHTLLELVSIGLGERGHRGHGLIAMYTNSNQLVYIEMNDMTKAEMSRSG